MAAPPTAATRLAGPQALWVILAGYLALGLGYTLATPVGEGPDEPGHVAYAVFLRQNHRLPVHGEVTDPVAQQVKHPPLFYALATLASLPFPLTDLPVVDNPQCCNLEAHQSPVVMRHIAAERFPYAPLYASVRWLRILVLLAGLATVWATWSAARLLWPGEPAFAVLAACLVAFLPQHLFMAGVVNNDGLANPLGALALWASLRVALLHDRPRDFLQLGLVLSFGLLAKLTFIAMVAVGGLAVLIAAWRRRSWRPLASAAVWTAPPMALLAGWWFIRNRLLYGDFLGWGKWESSAAMLLRHQPLLHQLPDYWAIQWSSFWGRFGWDTVPMPDAVYSTLGAVTFVALAGWGILVIRSLRRQNATEPADATEPPVSTPAPAPTDDLEDRRWGLGLVAVAALLVYLSVFRLAFDFDLTVAQGRYLFTGLPAFALLFAAGLLAWLPPRLEPAFARAGAIAMAALAAFALAFVLTPAFAVPPRVDLVHAAATDSFQSLRFGPHIRLLGARLPGTVRAGSPLDVQLIWSTDGLLDTGFVEFLHLVDANQAVPARLDTLPLGGRYPTISWLVDWPFADSVRLDVASWAAAGPARLRVGWYPDGQGDEPLTVTSLATGEMVEPYLGPIEIVR